VLDVVRGGDSVAIYPLPERTRRATTSLAWRREELSWALKALQAEIVLETGVARSKRARSFSHREQHDLDYSFPARARGT
jgi:hypothetical protein